MNMHDLHPAEFNLIVKDSRKTNGVAGYDEFAKKKCNLLLYAETCNYRCVHYNILLNTLTHGFFDSIQYNSA